MVRVAGTVGVSLFVGLMTAVAGITVGPALRMVAPLVCEPTMTDAVVVQWTEQTSDGTSITNDLYCLHGPAAVPTRPDTARVFFTFMAVGAAPTLLVLLAGAFIAFARRGSVLPPVTHPPHAGYGP